MMSAASVTRALARPPAPWVPYALPLNDARPSRRRAQLAACRQSSSSAARASASALPTDAHAVSTPSGGIPNPNVSPIRIGQPLPQTHPHLFPVRHPFVSGITDPVLPSKVCEDELTPGIPRREYEERRRKLMERLPDDSVVVVMAGRMKLMSGNIFYRFRQESNFWYLTGFQEPDAALILEKSSSSRGYKMTLFVQEQESSSAMWNGPKAGTDAASSVFSADEALPMEPSSFASHLKKVLPGYTHIYVDPPPGPNLGRGSSRINMRPSALLNALAPPSPSAYGLFSKKTDADNVLRLLADPRRCHPLGPHVDKLRVQKSTNELRVMKRAGDISGDAIASTIRFSRPSHLEAHLQAHFQYCCALRGSQRPAYVPVVAGGANALTIHYTSNDAMLRDGDMVCMDAGCELDGYASDITRTFPVGRRFSSAQADLYEAVLRVLKACTALATARQRYSLSELHRRSVELLRGELRSLGFDNLGGPGGNLERLLYPHYLSHHLGVDLHDVPSIDRSTPLAPGMVVTIEPGVYVPFDDRFPKHFQGLGIRIEDDVAVMDDHNVILSANAPKERVDIEALCEDGGA